MGVSVVIPTYNRNDLLFTRSLASVYRQTSGAISEVIVVADGMAGEELAELRARAKALQATVPHVPLIVKNIRRQVYSDDPGVKWSLQGTDARNAGLDLATGDWIAPLDDDDEWTEDHVEVLLKAAVEQRVDFAYGRSVTPWGQNYGFWPPSGMNFTDGSQLYRHDMGYRYDKDCVFSRGLPTDADLWTRMIAGGVTFVFVDQLVHRYYPAPR